MPANQARVVECEEAVSILNMRIYALGSEPLPVPGRVAALQQAAEEAAGALAVASATLAGLNDRSQVILVGPGNNALLVIVSQPGV